MSHAHHLSGCGSASGKTCTCEARRYWYIFGITLVIFVVQFIGSLLSGSLALLADTAHVGLDGTSVLISIWVASRVSAHRDPHALRTRGMRISGILLLVGLAWVAYEAIDRLQDPHEVPGLPVMVIATFGGAMNYWQHTLVPHDHTDTSRAQRLHVLGDLSTSIAVIIGGLLMAIWPNALWIDPALSLIVVCIVGVLTVRMLMQPAGSHGHHDHSH